MDGCDFRKAIMFLKKSEMSQFLANRSQFNQVNLVILIVGIVVALLRVHEFVARPEHGGTARQEKKTTEILDLRLRNAITSAGTLASPSPPQFQLKL